mgnify:CR=1 FL=1
MSDSFFNFDGCELISFKQQKQYGNSSRIAFVILKI